MANENEQEQSSTAKVAVANITVRGQIIVAIVTVIGSLGVAFLTTQATAKKRFSENQGEVKKLNETIDRAKDRIFPLPVGTVVPSLLTPALFLKEVGDRQAFDPEERNWVLADGKKDITLSSYGKLMVRRYTPDLRGMFLRGINDRRNDGNEDPQGEREPGHMQDDEFYSHSHDANMEIGAEPIHGEGRAYEAAGAHGRIGTMYTSTGLVKLKGGKETRPRNIAVYYYIKIN